MKKCNLYIHIGTPKTGTSAIQNFLYENREVLKAHRVLVPQFPLKYPNVRKVKNGHFLTSHVFNKDIADECMREINTYALDYSTIILTSETLFNVGLNDKNFWDYMKQALDTSRIQMKVVVYLRRQDTYLLSYWQQKIKESKARTKSFDEYIQEEYLENHFDYRAYLDKILECGYGLLGQEDLIVRPYERPQFVHHDLMADFMHAIGIQDQKEFVSPKKTANASIRDVVLEAKRFLNKVYGFRKTGNNMIPLQIKVQSQLDKEGRLGHRSGFTKERRQAFYNRYKEGNDEIARLYLHKEGPLFDDETIDDLETEAKFTYNELDYVYSLMLQFNDNGKTTKISDAKLQFFIKKALKKKIRDDLKHKYPFLLTIRNFLKPKYKELS